MKVIYTHPVIETESNVPKISGEEITNVNMKQIKEIIEGFSTVYDFVAANKDLVEKTVLELFNNVECRLILHATNHYATLLRLSTHPDLNSDPINKEVFLCKVGLNNIENRGNLLNYYEHQDLLNQDIPYFSTKFEKRDIYNSYQDKIEDVHLLRSPSENFEKRLKAFSQKDRKLQLDLIYWSFVHLLPVKNVTREYSKFDVIKYTDKEILDLAEVLGMEFELRTEEMYYVDTMSADLYKGLSGVALFFNMLYEAINIKQYEIYTRAVCHQMIIDLEDLTLDKLKSI